VHRENLCCAYDPARLTLSDPAVDFTRPAGEPALTEPDSVSWRVFKNPVALAIGGVAAVILELAEPRVRTGVWEHTSFRSDPVRRLRRTGMAAMVTVYGPRSAAEAMIAGVRRAHRRIQGRTPEGLAYGADDPELLAWVQATAEFGFLEASHAYVRPLPQESRDRFFREGVASGLLYGAVAAPRSETAFQIMLADMLPKMQASPVVFEFLQIMRKAPLLPPALRPLQGTLVRAAVQITPPEVRRLLGLGGHGLRPGEYSLVRLAGAAADRVVLEASPAVQACRRLGLPADYLYR
jgi:uncharacterized protein (DUF2236 family)